jgi:hypothetical protein
MTISFHYGKAIYKHWRYEQCEGLLKEYHNDFYRAAQNQDIFGASLADFSAQESTDDGNSDQTWTPGSEHSGQGIADAIDDLNRYYEYYRELLPKRRPQRLKGNSRRSNRKNKKPVG